MRHKLVAADAKGMAKMSTFFAKRSRVEHANDLSRAQVQRVLEANTGSQAQALLETLVQPPEGPLDLPKELRGLNLEEDSEEENPDPPAPSAPILTFGNTGCGHGCVGCLSTCLGEAQEGCEDEHETVATLELMTADKIRLTQRHSDGSLTPQYWVVDKMTNGGKSGYKCNVVHVSWKSQGKGGWTVEKIVGGKRVVMNPSSSVSRLGTVDAAFVEACAKRRGVVDTPGTKATIETQYDAATGTTTLVVPWCTHNTCRKTNASLALFAPNPRRTRDRFERFVIAEAVVGDPGATAEERADALNTLGETRTDQCFDCRAANDKTKHEGPDAVRAACEAMAEVIRQDLQKKGCQRCGYDGRAMQCEHVGRLGKIASLLRPSEWVGKGGPDAMWENYTEFTIPLCSFCHSLQDTHNAARGADSATMTKTQAKTHRQYKEENCKRNNTWKHARGECFFCKRQVNPGEERAFQWAHNREMMDRFTPRRFKKYTIAALQCSRICPATFRRMAWPEVRDCCQLGCANCHHTEETLPELEAEIGRLKAYVEHMRAQGGIRVVVEGKVPLRDKYDDFLALSDDE